ncbi:uncharacterized protein K452DRAFT_274074 [Aplosporella prunicola CBS 121167]|uniref:AMP-dependent synthetase/ligase domain-containing protein n=1 Tax=Aplosporella prunicola CBS 121167 TaxID=1176127 RepID=A0A6A6B8T0_9PEZI|nr:uncharacterized protein K452DRAFT_274074 [Aplosporella prunicola CBS 121167]KAF2140356.1 hypothetical protein K452DRAFT_274074 [Aplosporella prunicola CBS 121167]
MASFVEKLDSQLAELLAGWNGATTAIAIAIVTFLGYSIWLNLEDPDIHPMLLARSSVAAGIRQPGESAVYRSPQVPHGYPLQTGLSIPAEQRYQRRDGDLRDVWRKVAGKLPLDQGKSLRHPGRIFTVLGKDVVDHKVDDISKEINIIGNHIKAHGCKRVAVYLPNSIELLETIFAAAFYGFSPVLLPYNQPHDVVVSMLQRSEADSLIAEAGSIPLTDVTNGVPNLKQLIWVVEKTSRHVDWNEVPEGAGGRIEVSSWHEVIQDNISEANADLPANVSGQKAENLFMVWQDRVGGPGEIVEFTQQNLSAAIASLIAALPTGQRMNPSDLFLPADSLTHSYTLALTMAALFSHASVAINSVAGVGVELNLASRGIAPTIVAISAETAANLHSATSSSITSGLKKLAHHAETRALSAGRMPTNSLLTKFNAPTRAAVGTTPGKLRLVFVSEKAGADTPPLTSTDLSDLRIYLDARVVYALTAARVAGAISQTNIFDYRREDNNGGQHKHSHFGAPLNSVEIKLVDTPDQKTTDDRPAGEVVVMGPAVVGGRASISAVGTFRDDGCLAYV